MRHLKRSLHKFVVIGLMVGPFALSSALASPFANDVESAADHQVSAQGNYKKGLSNSWEWRFGTGRSATNITGIVAHGLLAAHRLTGQKAHHDSALKAAKSLIRAYDRGWRNRRPHTQDIEFLVASGYVIDAGRWFSVLTKRWSAPRYVDYVYRHRRAAKIPGILGWDVASAMRAALGVGQVAYAKQLVDRLIQKRRLWDRKSPSRNTSYGSLLWSLGELKKRAGLSATQKRFAASLVRYLTSSQHRSGGFVGGQGSDARLDTQATAYAVIGLSRHTGGVRAAKRARRWLGKVAIEDKTFFLGGKIWATHYNLSGEPDQEFHSEVQSEVLMALAATK